MRCFVDVTNFEEPLAWIDVVTTVRTVRTAVLDLGDLTQGSGAFYCRCYSDGIDSGDTSVGDGFWDAEPSE